MPPNEKTDLMAYQLKGITKVWYAQWVDERGEEVGTIAWEEFKGAFLDHLFPLTLREAKMQEFINLRQGTINVREYFTKFYVCPIHGCRSKRKNEQVHL